MRPLILLDWDDTLFPTTWILKGANVGDARQGMDIVERLLEVDKAVCSLLRTCLMLGDVSVVTNASMNSVLLLASHVPHALSAMRSGVRLVSARDDYSHNFRANDWKRIAFKSEALRAGTENVVSVGDSKREYDALRELQGCMRNAALKHVRTASVPSLRVLVRQLRSLEGCIGSVCRHRGSASLVLR